MLDGVLSEDVTRTMLQCSNGKLWALYTSILTIKWSLRSKKLVVLFLFFWWICFFIYTNKFHYGTDAIVTEESLHERNNFGASSLSDMDLFDYTYCSVLSPLRIYVHASNHPLAKALDAHPAAVKTPDSACFVISVGEARHLSHTGEWRKNIVLVNLDEEKDLKPVANEMIVQPSFAHGSYRSILDIALFTDVKAFSNKTWRNRPSIMPIGREMQSQIVFSEYEELKNVPNHIPLARCNGLCEQTLVNTSFCLLPASRTFQRRLISSLRAGCIPVVLSRTQSLPFQEELDWRLASFRYPISSLRLIPQILERVPKEEVLEMRRRGRIFLRRLDHAEALAETLVAALSERIMVDLPPFYERAQSVSLSDSVRKSTAAPSRFAPPPSSLYSHRRWNDGSKLAFAPTTLYDVPMMPGDAAFYNGTKERIVPMNSETNLDRALGLTRDEEQFTVIVLTHDRIDGVRKVIENLRGCDFLHKIVIIWNNKKGSPPVDLLKMDAPIEIIIAEKNSLNNRFIPYESIETEAVISMDDDVYVTQSELVFAFRMWRENRNRIVGFPSRFHTEVNGKSKYGLSSHHEYSLILTGLAIIHKEFLYEFTYNQHPAILDYIDTHFNCEDIAMNYLVAHLTRRPPLGVIKKTNLSNGSKVGLFSRGIHLQERSECIDMLNKIYGYNPLAYSQAFAVPLQDDCVNYSWSSVFFRL